MSTQASNYTLPYCPAPPVVLEPIRNWLLAREFSESSIRADHIFTARGLGLKVHQAAFTDPQQWDLSTSGVNFYYNSDRLQHQHILNTLLLSGAPFNLIGEVDSVSLYILSQRDNIQIRSIEKDVAYDRIPDLFARYNADITPRRIQRAKQGIDSFILFPDFSPLQLRLFAVDVTGKILVEQFRAAVQRLRSAMRRRKARLDEKNIAVQLLAAVILAHKGVLGSECLEPDAPLELVIDQAYRKFDRYFSPVDIRQYNRAAEEAFSVLQQVRYSSFTPEILEDLYVAAYPESELRKWEGRYNTPLYLTHRILENIPIETIPPAQRIVADMTCGVGNFLQSAYERLSGLTDMQDSDHPLREHILGNDRDKFTAQLAGLSLLLTSRTDQWRIDSEDALQWSWLSQNAPTVIVGNPPFLGSRKLGKEATELDPETGKPKRYQKADAFLERAIRRLAPGGYLAMVMPQSFGVAQASPATRRLLLEQCDVLEVWELPNEVFADATVRPMVVFAQRKPDEKSGRISSTPVRVRTVQRKTLQDFIQGRASTASSIVPSQEMWGPNSKRGPKNTHLMRCRIILPYEQWTEIRQSTCSLEEIAEITLGAIIGSKNRWRWSDYPHPKRVNWLPEARKSLPRSYYIRYGNDTKLYPNEFEEPRKNRRYPHLDKEYLLANDKVLLVSNPDPTWGQRVTVAIEKRGYYPSGSFWVLALKPELPEHITLEVLASVVSWYVSNAWIVESLKTTKVSRYAIDSIPFPCGLKAVDCRELEVAVHQLETAAQYGQDAPDAQRTIDRVLKAAYRLDEATFERLRMVARWNDIDPAHLVKPRPSLAEMVSVTGGVEEVDARNGMIVLWLSGFDGLQKMPITDEMPGWMLRPGAVFRARISEENYRRQSLDDVVWAHIIPQEYTYLTEDQLLDRLDASFSETANTIAIVGQ